MQLSFLDNPTRATAPASDPAVGSTPTDVGTSGDTRIAAARMVAPVAGSRRDRILAAIRTAGPHGLTDHEGSRHLGILLQSYLPLRNKLVEDGLVRDSGKTRPSPNGRPGHRPPCHVWVATDIERPAGGPTPGHTSPAAGGQGRPSDDANTAHRGSTRATTAATQPAGGVTSPDVRNPFADPRPLAICPRCGFDQYRDVPSADGQTTRRECKRCKYVMGWPRWHGQPIAPANPTTEPRPEHGNRA